MTPLNPPPTPDRSDSLNHESPHQNLPDAPDYGNLIYRLIESQQQLTAVEKFSQSQPVTTSAASNSKSRYRDLIPLEAPTEGEQYSFEVDLDACSGCKSCVAACHSLNGLDEGELWRNVGMLVGGGEAEPVLQHVTASCHHCLEPACMHGCPVNAYEKDPVTGIVEHLDDQCIGCKYCMFMCPYDVPSYSPAKGIVRKCNMCADRLAVGEAPACVQACPHEAIKIGKVSSQEIIDNSETDQLVPGAPDVHLTLPTTRYNTQRVLPRNLLPEDYYIAKPLHAHFPLVFMLTFTQMAFGIFATSFLIERRWASVGQSIPAFLNTIGLVTLVIGLSVAILHLGRPLKAYRAMAGIRTSWLSREILAFNLFAGAASALVAWSWSDIPMQLTGVPKFWLAITTTVTGIVAVLCSAMLYIVTKRPLWTGGRTCSLFFLTSAILGIATTAVVVHCLAAAQAFEFWQTSAPFVERLTIPKIIGLNLVKALLCFTFVKFAIEGVVFTHLRSVQFTPQRHAARLMIGDMQWPTAVRFVFMIVGGILLPLLYIANASANGSGTSDGGAILVTIMFALLLPAELHERYLFFAVSVARRMPGAPN